MFAGVDDRDRPHRRTRGDPQPLESQQRESPVLVFEGRPASARPRFCARARDGRAHRRAGPYSSRPVRRRDLLCRPRRSAGRRRTGRRGIASEPAETGDPQRPPGCRAPRGEINPRAVAVAMHSIVAALASSGVVIVIDDLQWLDRPTAGAIAFLARRLPARSAVIASRRLAPHDDHRSLRPLAQLCRRAPRYFGSVPSTRAKFSSC